MVDASDPRLQVSRAGCAFFALPPIAIVLTILAYVWLVYNGILGRPAEGAVTRIAFVGCPEASEIVGARAAAMGLADAVVAPSADGFTLTATLPAEADVAAQIPATLAQPGHLTIHTDDGAMLVDDAGVDEAGVRMDLLMRPATWVRFTPEARTRVHEHVKADPDGELVVAIDGAEVWRHANSKEPGSPEIELPPSAEDDRARMHLAAGRGIVLDDPLPCDVTVRSVGPAE